MPIQPNGWRRWKLLASCIAFVSLGSITGYSQANAVLYEGCHVQSDGGTLILGSSSHLGVGVYVNVVRGEVRLGGRVLHRRRRVVRPDLRLREVHL